MIHFSAPERNNVLTLIIGENTVTVAKNDKQIACATTDKPYEFAIKLLLKELAERGKSKDLARKEVKHGMVD